MAKDIQSEQATDGGTRGAVERVTAGIQAWMQRLESYPGWKDWQRDKFRYVMDFDDPESVRASIPEREFKFTDEIEKQHAVVIQFLGLQGTIQSVVDCEFYFRRYPFAGLPITRQEHLINVCEMYFGRFYEFEERLARYLNALATTAPRHRIEIGEVIRDYKKAFATELRIRHIGDLAV